MVNKWLNIIQNWCFPSTCLLCDLPAQAHIQLCTECYKDLNLLDNYCRHCAIPLAAPTDHEICGQCLKKRPYFDRSISLFSYQPPVSQLIQSLKFSHQLSIASALGQLLAEKILADSPSLPDLLIPVPLHRKRQRQRGFNQSMEIARTLAKILNIPVKPMICSRVRATTSQSLLKAEQRPKNVRHAFQVHHNLEGKYVAVVDDVVTTGSTVNELSRVLKRHGARQVDIWSIARAEHQAS